MIELKTTLSQIEIVANGPIQVRLLKQVVDGEKVISAQYHRCTIADLSSLEATIEATDEHLRIMGYPPLNKNDWNRIRAHSALAWEQSR